jgi:hypothetical protein
MLISTIFISCVDNEESNVGLDLQVEEDQSLDMGLDLNLNADGLLDETVLDQEHILLPANEFSIGGAQLDQLICIEEQEDCEEFFNEK